jgi:hypothetical protein
VAEIVFQAKEYGEEVTGELRATPSSKNWTLAIPMLEEADAVTVVDPETVAPEVGAVIETVGGVVLV